MQYITMNYKGFEFKANPTSLKVCYTKSIARRKIPFSASVSQEMSNSEAVIKGNGSFLGKDAMKKAYEMLRVFNRKGSDYLFCSSAIPIKAFFSDLDISYSSTEEKVDYSFTFIQDEDSKASDYDFGYTIAQENENAFDIANRTGIEIEKIVEANDLEDLFAIKQGDKIWLA